MPNMSDIIKDSVVEFSRLQNWMLSAKENNDISTYKMMFDRYVELKVILATAGVNVTELDKIKEYQSQKDGQLSKSYMLPVLCFVTCILPTRLNKPSSPNRHSSVPWHRRLKQYSRFPEHRPYRQWKVPSWRFAPPTVLWCLTC